VHLPNHSFNAGGEYGKYPLTIHNAWGEGEPEITDQLISFNGDESRHLSGETMYFPRVFEPQSWQFEDTEKVESGLFFDCCKTRGKPYDLIVCATLMVIKYHCPEIQVSSDGNPKDWEPSLFWYRDCFGNKRSLPQGPWVPDFTEVE